MSYYYNLLHIVWSTKYRNPYLANQKRRYELFEHIKNVAAQKEIYVDHIGGMSDHVHCLISLKAHQRLVDVVRLIKAESVFWYNTQSNIRALEWQDGYFAVSVSPKDIDNIRNYIRNQEIHHQNRTFEQEYNEFIKMMNKENERI